MRGNGKTTWFNFLASHDGIGLNPLRGIIDEPEIVALVDTLEKEGAKVNWKNNPDGTRSPYEINVTYLDALSAKESEDNERIARFILAHAVLLSFPGVPAVYIQSILGSRNDYDGVERLGDNSIQTVRRFSRRQARMFSKLFVLRIMASALLHYLISAINSKIFIQILKSAES